MEHTLRNPEELHSTILESMIEIKRPPEQSCNTFIRWIKINVGVGSYRALKEMTVKWRNDSEEWRKGVENQPKG